MPGRNQGRAVRRRAHGRKADDLHRELSKIDSRAADWANDFVFGEIWTRPGLAFEDRMLVVISMLGATNHITQLRNYLHGAFQAGIDEAKIHEALLMLVIYAGFPTAFDALACWHDVKQRYQSGGV